MSLLGCTKIRRLSGKATLRPVKQSGSTLAVQPILAGLSNELKCFQIVVFRAAFYAAPDSPSLPFRDQAYRVTDCLVISLCQRLWPNKINMAAQCGLRKEYRLPTDARAGPVLT